MGEIYSSLSRYYDILSDHLDFDKYADFIIDTAKENGIGIPFSVYDMACGTGTLAIALSKRCCKVTAGDLSTEMLSVAYEKASENNAKVLFVNQDMRHVTLPEKVDVIVSATDSVNYLTTSKDLKTCFGNVYNNLTDGGVFIFDVNSKNKFENIYGCNSYILEEEGVYCGWENSYNPKTQICDFFISLFVLDEDGKYIRFDERQREKYHSDKVIKKTLSECGFTLLNRYFDIDKTDFKPNDKTEECSERVFYICKKERK